jgi:hypothetical protein
MLRVRYPCGTISTKRGRSKWSRDMACRTYKISLLSAKKTRKVEEDERLGINNPGTSLAVTQKIIRDSWLFLKTSFSNEHVEYKCSDLSWKGHDSLLREQIYLNRSI